MKLNQPLQQGALVSGCVTCSALYHIKALILSEHSVLYHIKALVLSEHSVLYHITVRLGQARRADVSLCLFLFLFFFLFFFLVLQIQALDELETEYRGKLGVLEFENARLRETLELEEARFRETLSSRDRQVELMRLQLEQLPVGMSECIITFCECTYECSGY